MKAKDIISIQIEEAQHNFGMFSKAGGNRMRTLTKRVVKRIFSKYRVTEIDIERMFTDGLNKIGANEKYSECFDTEPRSIAQHYIKTALKVAGYSFYNNIYL